MFTGGTPLSHAVEGEHKPTVIYLINNGADLNKSDSDGITPLHSAVKKVRLFVGSTELVKLLISKGADISASSIFGTPLHIAAHCGRLEVLEYLLELKADPNSSGCCMSPLLLSMVAKSLHCMELLLKAGADPNRVSVPMTPLIYAVTNGEEETIPSLLKAGADPNLTDFLGKTPLELAAMYGFIKGVMILFPVTSRIACYPDWSPRGVMQHVHSAEALEQSKLKQKELFSTAKANGRDAFEKKYFFEAIYWYTQASQAKPADARVLSNRSLCWALLKDGKRALPDAQASVALGPSWPKAHYREGAAWKLLKKYDKAAEAFSRALALDPHNQDIEKEYRAVQAKCGKSNH
ncbi:OLC1v1004232C1 [Oldenlandia corymbosa var. corymbosa]|uniref:OLC1v1004232C1 n=1 Tax=Oldenlandia corymbosa var. corymbosa TaxID=529605 RepID=A0AAV1DC29_OLDCO|nr:OLC1v1004232C1 [Oldenlandia corymbosa var. corymbosa]